MALSCVTSICKTLEEYTDLKTYLDNVIKTCKMKKKTTVHKSFYYRSSIIEKRLYAVYGVFIDYFIRRYLAEKLNIAFEDIRAKTYYDDLKINYNNIAYEKILNKNEIDDFLESEPGIIITRAEELEDGQVELLYIISKPGSSPIAQRVFEDDHIIPGYSESYEKVVDTQTYRTMDILNDLSNVCNAHFVWFNEKILTEPLDYNEENLMCVTSYLDKLVSCKDEVLLNPSLGGKYFEGDGDLIINDVIIDIKNSKFENRALTDFYQLIMYSYGAFENLGKKIKKFMIYNPLLGIEYEIELDDLNYEEFGQALKCCVACE